MKGKIKGFHQNKEVKIMDEKKEEKKSKITSSTTFDERRKLLTHKSREEKETEFGNLVIEATDVRHEEGIKKTLSSLETQKKTILEDIKRLEEVIGPAPKMTPELEQLKENLTKLQLIRHHENSNEESRRKEQQQLDQNKENLKKVEKDLKEIKDAIGSRMKI